MTSAASLEPSDRWIVTDGIVTFGPVTFDVILRHVSSGRLRSTALVRHQSWKVWHRLAELEDQSAQQRRQFVETQADWSAGVDVRASSPDSVPPPPPPCCDIAPPNHDSTPPPPSSRRLVDPVGVLARARDLNEALMLTLSTVLAAARAEVGLTHHYRPEYQTLVTTNSYGGGAERLLGERMLTSDPTLAAARACTTVLVEPQPGEAGRHIMGRLSRCLEGIRGAAAVPFCMRGELIALFEFARTGRAFSAREIARVEEVIQALGERVLVMGWG